MPGFCADEVTHCAYIIVFSHITSGFLNRQSRSLELWKRLPFILCRYGISVLMCNMDWLASSSLYTYHGTEIEDQASISHCNVAFPPMCLFLNLRECHKTQRNAFSKRYILKTVNSPSIHTLTPGEWWDTLARGDRLPESLINLTPLTALLWEEPRVPGEIPGGF